MLANPIRGLMSVLLVVGLSSVCFAQAPSRKSSDRTVISMQMDYGKPTVLARINGKGPWPFLVDSGAGVTIVNEDLVEELDLPVVGKQRLGDPSNPEAIEADTVRIDTIQVGDVTFQNVVVASWDRSNLYKAKTRPKGVLGIELFSEYLLTFDYPSKEIAMEKGELAREGDKETIPFEIDFGNIPSIKLSVAGKTMNAHFDTGSPAALTVPSNMEREFELKGPARVVGKARTVNSEFEIRAAQLRGDLVIASHTFNDPRIIFVDVLNDIKSANIGSGLLRDYVLTFDQKNRLVRLHRP